jgi:pimeloyl-ACP methyl ester carboxylesterase
MKTVLFVPGFQEDLNFRNYASTITAIEKQGYRVKFVPINWKRTTIKDWVNELDRAYASYDSGQTVLAGFSYGAMTAFISATKRNPSELWLFSLSPYFAKDLKSKNMESTWLKQIGKRRVAAFSELSFSDLAKSVECKTLLFVGRVETTKWPVMHERTNEAHKLLKTNELIVIEGVGHDVADSRYISGITQII